MKTANAVRSSNLERCSGKTFARIPDMGYDEPQPEQDPTVSVSVSFHSSVIGEVRQRVGKRGVSAYVEAAVRRQIERDHLRELIEANEAIHGEITADEIQAAREEIYGPSSGGAAS